MENATQGHITTDISLMESGALLQFSAKTVTLCRDNTDYQPTPFKVSTAGPEGIVTSNEWTTHIGETDRYYNQDQYKQPRDLQKDTQN